MSIPQIVIPNTGLEELNIPNIWVMSSPAVHPEIPYVPVTTYIGKPIVDIPGCVEVNKNNNTGAGGTKNKSLDEDDDVVTYCDEPGMSGYDAMNYVPDQLIIKQKIPLPEVEPPAEINPPEAEAPVLPKDDIDCPGVGQLRVGDLTQSGDERVTGHKLSDDGKVCITLYEDTSPTEKFLPSLNQASTTAAIAIIATAGAAATPLLIRLIKPAVKKAISTFQKKIGIHRGLSKSEIRANAYRAKKGLPPLKNQSKKSVKK